MFLEELILIIEKNYSKVWIFEEGFDHIDFEHDVNATYHDKYVTIRQYIDIQANTILNYGKNNIFIEYNCYALSKEEQYLKYEQENNILIHDLTEKDQDNLQTLFRSLMPDILQLKIFLLVNKTIECNIYIKSIKLIILLVYLISWLYILFISIPTLPDLPITLSVLDVLTRYSILSDPFSGALLL
jgi:hypothetical protein